MLSQGIETSEGILFVFKVTKYTFVSIKIPMEKFPAKMSPFVHLVVGGGIKH